jgi:hypothetical protein
MPIPFISRKPGQCAYPDPPDGVGYQMTVCGELTINQDSSWCRDHAAIVYGRTPAPRPPSSQHIETNRDKRRRIIQRFLGAAASGSAKRVKATRALAD